jgi:D-arabinose 1-dehydrogenase-like Zn-dependent alcohol dehydrogenase
MVHTDEEVLKANVRKFDVILDTVAEPHPVAGIVNTLKVGGNYVLLGGIPKPFEVVAFPLLLSRHSIEGSLVGGMAETQQMLDFCAKHGVVPECKTIHAKDASAHFISMGKGETGPIRAVIDISTIKDM